MNKNNQPTLEELREINKHISDALKQWANICIMSDAENWSIEYEFTEDDVMNVVHIFNSVISNVGIKKGLITEENAFKVGFGIYDFVSKYTGVDTRKFYRELKENEIDITSEVPQE